MWNGNEIEVHTDLRGLGTTISLFSALFSTGMPVKFYTTEYGHNFIGMYKSLFGVPDNIITSVIEDPIVNSQFDNFTDTTKIFSKYPNYNSFFYKGQKYDIVESRPKKPFIALCCYNNNQHIDQLNTDNVFPRNRTYPLSVYSTIFSLIKMAGYDVMVLDSIDISIPEKAFLLNEFCEALITYEGGVAHLAHILKIPTIILPWHHFPSGKAIPEKDWNYFSHKFARLHLDRKTYFCRLDELLSLNRDSLDDMINLLKTNRGNNPLLSSGINLSYDKNFNIKIHPQHFTIERDDLFRPFDAWLHSTFFKDGLKLGGIKSMELVDDVFK